MAELAHSMSRYGESNRSCSSRTPLTYICHSAGIPQVLLPAWSDCFDYGNRVELLKVGRWANKVAKPSWKRNELASALEEVILSDKAAAILEQVKRLSKNYPEGAGRNYAAKEILSAIQS